MLRNRLPAALLLLLSWFLPAAAHAQAVQQVAAASAATWRAEQPPSGMRQVPPPAPDVRAWSGPGSMAGASAALTAEHSGVRPAWSVLAPASCADAPANRRPLAAAARAPPSTVL
ncbi:hypothetical protein AB0I81_05285 [Nonomuraea sp. NPDC050404]|uniref:hypothetical protein n=1 Tax=Nonomuraea sp. NPDC050404 TaxID=3155783 RepID=UPI00340139D2